MHKLKCFNGDVTYPNLNLSVSEVKELEENVTTVFHMAANVRFDQPLKSAVLLNTGERILKNPIRIQFFIHSVYV